LQHGSFSIDIRFLELSVPTDDVRESLDFYLRLGFTELSVNDIRSHFYAAVTDGRIAIGLHGDDFEAPTLTFVSTSVDRRALDLMEAGHEPEPCRIGEEDFHEIGLLSPSGHALRFVEARTWSPAGDVPPPVIGRATEVSLRCRQEAAEARFWEIAGFITDDDGGDDDGVTLRAPGIVLGLHVDLRVAGPVLRYAPEDMDATLDRLEQLEVDCRRQGDESTVTAPEGTRLTLIRPSAYGTA
jgi:hypothetical protein